MSNTKISRYTESNEIKILRTKNKELSIGVNLCINGNSMSVLEENKLDKLNNDFVIIRDFFTLFDKEADDIDKLEEEYKMKFLIDKKYEIMINLKTDNFIHPFYPYQLLSLYIDQILPITPKIRNKIVCTIPPLMKDDSIIKLKKSLFLYENNDVPLIYTPLCVIIAYFLNDEQSILKFKKEEEEENSSNFIVVYDLGYKTFSCSLLNVKEDEIELINSKSEYNLGGYNLTYNLVNLYSEIIDEYSDDRIEDNPRRYNRLIKSLEKAKCDFNSKESVEVEFNELYDYNIDVELKYEVFNNVNEEIYNRTIEIMKEVIKGYEDKISDVILSGGSCRLSYIYNLLENNFIGMKIHKEIDPLEVVSIGSSIYCYKYYNNILPKCLKNTNNYINENIVYKSITINDIGIKYKDEKNEEKVFVLIKEGSELPISCRKKVYMKKNNQSEIKIEIVEYKNTSEIDKNEVLFKIIYPIYRENEDIEEEEENKFVELRICISLNGLISIFLNNERQKCEYQLAVEVVNK